MPRQPKLKPDNPEEFKRFLDLAREVGADQASENFDRVFQKVAERDPAPLKPKRQRASSRGE